jgi:hypothetical protein
MHGMQAWVALPLEHEETEPDFANYKEDALPTYENDGLWARLIAGSAFGAEAKVKTHSPMFYIHWELQPGVKTGPAVEHEERAIYIAAGKVEVAGREYGDGEMVVFEHGAQPTITGARLSPPSCASAAPTSASGSSGGTWSLRPAEDRGSQGRLGEPRPGAEPLHPTARDDQEFIPCPRSPSPPRADELEGTKTPHPPAPCSCAPERHMSGALHR